MSCSYSWFLYHAHSNEKRTIIILRYEIVKMKFNQSFFIFSTLFTFVQNTLDKHNTRWFLQMTVSIYKYEYVESWIDNDIILNDFYRFIVWLPNTNWLFQSYCNLFSYNRNHSLAWCANLLYVYLETIFRTVYYYCTNLINQQLIKNNIFVLAYLETTFNMFDNCNIQCNEHRDSFKEQTIWR